jgi:hypothetical protein
MVLRPLVRRKPFDARRIGTVAWSHRRVQRLSTACVCLMLEILLARRRPSRPSHSHMSALTKRILAAIVLCVASVRAAAQENYEIQVYGSETVAPHVTMFELHSNYTIDGSKIVQPDGELPTNHAVHETLEITHGFTNWAELGFYWFTAIPAGQGWQWVGPHLRPRVRAPDSWGWPVGVSISQEIGYARQKFAGDTWTYEFRPIIDKQMGGWYVSLNQTLEKSLRGPNASTPFVF